MFAKVHFNLNLSSISSITHDFTSSASFYQHELYFLSFWFALQCFVRIFRNIYFIYVRKNNAIKIKKRINHHLICSLYYWIIFNAPFSDLHLSSGKVLFCYYLLVVAKPNEIQTFHYCRISSKIIDIKIISMWNFMKFNWILSL